MSDLSIADIKRVRYSAEIDGADVQDFQGTSLTVNDNGNVHVESGEEEEPEEEIVKLSMLVNNKEQ